MRRRSLRQTTIFCTIIGGARKLFMSAIMIPLCAITVIQFLQAMCTKKRDSVQAFVCEFHSKGTN